MKKVLLLSFAALAVFAGCKKDNTGGNGGNGGGNEPEVNIEATNARIENTSVSIQQSGGTGSIALTLTPADATPMITWSIDNSNLADLDQSNPKNLALTGKANGKTTVKCHVENKSGSSFDLSATLYVYPIAVDMGFPSGKKWASANLGATDENDEGYLIAWGEIEPKEDYRLWTDEDHHYRYYDGTMYTKYISATSYLDNDGDDPARAMLNMIGAKWRMPLAVDVQELLDNSTVIKLYDASASRVRALKFTSTVPGYTENSIVLPYVHIIETTVEAAASVSRYGLFYWSSSVDEDTSKTGTLKYWRAKILAAPTGDTPQMSSWARYNGLAIRPVYVP